MKTDKKSHVLKHLNDSQRYKASSSNDYFSVVDYVTTQHFLSIKECMQIGWQKLALTKQVDFWTCSIYL